MIKVQNHTATREPLPQFLVGLAPESLLDLSWTDPSLGVSDCGWWPIEENAQPLGRFEVCGDETLTVDRERKVVIVTHSVLPMSDDQKNALVAEKASVVRQERNRRLSVCDWTQLPDAPVDSAAWASYRQALRDITDQAGFPFDIEWPAPPS